MSLNVKVLKHATYNINMRTTVPSKESLIYPLCMGKISKIAHVRTMKNDKLKTIALEILII